MQTTTTFNVTLRRPTGGRWTFSVMAPSKVEAERKALQDQPEGVEAIRVQRAPNRYRQFPR